MSGLGLGELVMSGPQARPSNDALLAAFAAAGVTSRPYAYALDVTGEGTLGLIEADPLAGTSARPVLEDGDWLRLQQICEG